MPGFILSTIAALLLFTLAVSAARQWRNVSHASYACTALLLAGVEVFLSTVV